MNTKFKLSALAGALLLSGIGEGMQQTPVSTGNLSISPYVKIQRQRRSLLPKRRQLGGRTVIHQRRWTREEISKLDRLVAIYGEENWKIIAAQMESRTSFQCKERWTCCSSPKVKKGDWTEEEEHFLLSAFERHKSLYGDDGQGVWAAISRSMEDASTHAKKQNSTAMPCQMAFVAGAGERTMVRRRNSGI